MRIDAHHHFWELGRYHYPWLSSELRPICRNFGPADLSPLLKRHHIDRTILVQTISSFDETKWFLSLARHHAFIAGVVGWIDLKAPNVSALLDELLANAGLVGIRHAVQDEPNVNWLLDPAVQRGLSEVAKHQLAYDLLIRPAHLAVSLQIVEAFPDLTFVVDHLAKPNIARRGWDDWASGTTQLAQHPNVWCKLSGMITEADRANWKPNDLKPYLDHALECFGPGRVMFGSDWPVCLLAGAYDHVVEALETNVNHLTPDERKAIFGQNAAKCYKLTDRK